MFDDDVKTTLIKAGIMLVILAAEWWVMQPYHDPILARIWSVLARFCYRVARRFGEMGLHYEFNYYEAMA
jgi:hypothetical protein